MPTAESVVRPELEDEDVNRSLQEPINPAQSARAGLAAQAGVDHFIRKLFRLDLLLDQRGKGLALLEAVARGQTVAEKQNRPAENRRREKKPCAGQEKNPPPQILHARAILIA